MQVQLQFYSHKAGADAEKADAMLFSFWLSPSFLPAPDEDKEVSLTLGMEELKVVTLPPQPCQSASPPARRPPPSAAISVIAISRPYLRHVPLSLVSLVGSAWSNVCRSAASLTRLVVAAGWDQEQAQAPVDDESRSDHGGDVMHDEQRTGTALIRKVLNCSRHHVAHVAHDVTEGATQSFVELGIVVSRLSESWLHLFRNETPLIFHDLPPLASRALAVGFCCP